MKLFTMDSSTANLVKTIQEPDIFIESEARHSKVPNQDVRSILAKNEKILETKNNQNIILKLTSGVNYHEQAGEKRDKTQSPEIVENLVSDNHCSTDVLKDDGSNIEKNIAIQEERMKSIDLGLSESSSSCKNTESVGESKCLGEYVLKHVECLAHIELLRKESDQTIEQLKAALLQKDNIISLYQRENIILEKEKQAFRKEKEMALKEKEATVIKFAMQEKLLIDAKKEQDKVGKLLENAKTEIKNISLRFHAVNEEKSRMVYVFDEKCNEARKYQRDCEKLKIDINHLESKLKYHANKLSLELEAKNNLEKKLDDERKAPNKLEEQINEKYKAEYEANAILLKHEIESYKAQIEVLRKDLKKSHEGNAILQEGLDKAESDFKICCAELETLRLAHNSLENSYSEVMLNSAKLHTQLEAFHVLKTQNALNEEKITNLERIITDLERKIADQKSDLEQLHSRELELLSINREVTEAIVRLQNECILLKAQAQALESDNKMLKQKNQYKEATITSLESQLKKEINQKTEERLLLTKHLSEKTKLYEVTKAKLDNIVGDFEALQNKKNTIIKELQREIQKYKNSIENKKICNGTSPTRFICSYCKNMFQNDYNSEQSDNQSTSSRPSSEASESGTVVSNSVRNEVFGPSKKHLVDRILRLQQASARQTEKIDFLENHTLSLVSELQKKSKVVQYYMLRDQAGALTSSKSDQNKSELSKYGNGVMSAIYGGIKGDNQKGMTLELSLEINKKLQAVLEDTLLKNITLKENLDVLGLEVDNLTRKLRQVES